MIDYNPQLLLEDHSLDIPPYLQRNEDGTLRWPAIAVAVVADRARRAQEIPSVSFEDRLEEGRDKDRAAAANIRLQYERATSVRKSMEDTVKRAEKARQRALDKERKARIIHKNRVDFAKTFKWDWEK